MAFSSMGGNSNKKDGDELVRTCDPVTIREWDPNEGLGGIEGKRMRRVAIVPCQTDAPDGFLKSTSIWLHNRMLGMMKTV